MRSFSVRTLYCSLRILHTLFAHQELQQFKHDCKWIVTPSMLDAVHPKINDDNIEICGEKPTRVIQCYGAGPINKLYKRKQPMTLTNT